MPKHLRLKPYADQKSTWPDRGQIILAQYDDSSIVVYQAYRPEIARSAVERQQLGGSRFSLDRMSWVKTRFLWMMHRSEWATARDQERILAIWMDRPAFDAVLAAAVPSRYEAKAYPTQAEWQAALDASEVRLQWDPDYDLKDIRHPRRRAIQLGLRGETLRRFATEWITYIEDITPLVHAQARFRAEEELILVPAERLYPVKDPAVARRLGLDKSSA